MLHRAYEKERNTLEKWSEGFPDRDNKFIKELQTSFNSSFWEIYLHALFKDLGFTFDWSQSSPDFNVEHLNERFVVEATTANAADGKPKEWEREISTQAARHINIPEINKEAIVRLSNAIYTKSQKYLSSYRNLNHVAGRPYVIAIAPFEQPFFMLQHDRAIRALLFDYYIDEETYYKCPEKYPSGPPGISLGTIEKSNGSEISLGFFKDNSLEHVSAVLFSCIATMGKLDALSPKGIGDTIFNSVRTSQSSPIPKRYMGEKKADYIETIQDGLQVYHNPYAKYPLSTAHFRKAGIAQHYFNSEKNEWVYEEADNALSFRNSIKAIPREAGNSEGKLLSPDSLIDVDPMGSGS